MQKSGRTSSPLRWGLPTRLVKDSRVYQGTSWTCMVWCWRMGWCSRIPDPDVQPPCPFSPVLIYWTCTCRYTCTLLLHTTVMPACTISSLGSAWTRLYLNCASVGHAQSDTGNEALHHTDGPDSRWDEMTKEGHAERNKAEAANQVSSPGPPHGDVEGWPSDSRVAAKWPVRRRGPSPAGTRGL